MIEEYLINTLGEMGFFLLKKMLTISIAIIIYIFMYKAIKKLVNNFFIKTRNASEKYRLDDRRLITLNAVSLSMLKYFFYFLVCSSIITFFGGADSIKSILAVAGLGGVAIGFAAQNFVKDVITGFFILLENQISVGDIVELTDKNINGSVEEIGIRTTKLRNFNGDLHIIPNSQITIVTNKSRDFKRAIVDIGVSYDDNIENIIEILSNEMKNIHQKVQGLYEIPQVQGVINFDDSAIIIRIISKCDINEVYTIEREIRKYIKLRFDSEKISMPYPHQTVELKNLNYEGENL